MKTSYPSVYGSGMNAKQTPEIIGSDRSANGGKAKARYPHKPLTNKPGGGGNTSGAHKAALTPGTTPSGS